MTDEAADKRFDSYRTFHEIMRNLRAEEAALSKSFQVYLGRVTRANPFNYHTRQTEFTVEPVWRVRGRLPTKPVTIEERIDPAFDNCPFNGRSPVYSPNVGDLIFIFDAPGDLQTKYASKVRADELIDALNQYIVAQLVASGELELDD
ncbi:hypothetical protein [Sphingomicrobium marinum]|uniref:hypothetical protein n=1 Tax=Sphingomicrobium marinum TaxID=1227950 RepID=UPI002240C27F|nr:hypothetical protein [Sphingomicrobium marinum]